MNLITGGAGLLGWNLARELRDRGESVRVFDFRESHPMLEGVEYVKGDIRDAKAVKRACEGSERVWHLAALMHVGKIKPEVVEEVNMGGLENVMAAAEKNGVKRIIFTSTIELYGVKPEVPCFEDSPKNPPPGYPTHKYEGEKRLLDFSRRTGIEVAFTRMPMIFGPGFYHQKIVLLFFEALALGLPVPLLDDGALKGTAVALSDAVEGLILAGNHSKAAGEAFNICSGEVWTHRSLIEEVIKRTGSKSKVVSVPSAPLTSAFDALAVFHLNPIATEHFHFALHDCVYDISKARLLLGYNPKKSTADAIVETCEAYRERGRKDLWKAVANSVVKK